MISLANRNLEIEPFYVMELLARANQLERTGKHIIHMEIGEPDFPTPAVIANAGLESISSNSVRYTQAAGLPDLRRAISNYYKKHYRTDIDSNRIFITPGASGAFLLVLGLVLNPNKEILLADPGYPCNRNFIRLFDGVPRFISVDASTDFQLNIELIQKNWTENTCGILIASPSNPTGTIIKKEELGKILSWLETKAGFLISDEIYHGLEYGDRAISALELTNTVFVINSFSKYFGMTGWRIGWLVVPDSLVDEAEKLAQNIFICAPTHSQYAAIAAFVDKNISELERRKIELQKRRDCLYTGLKRLGFDIHANPEGAFYIYAECSQFSTNSFEFAWQLLEQAGVAVTPGKDFGSNKADIHLRFAYTTSIDQLNEGLKRIEKFIGQSCGN